MAFPDELHSFTTLQDIQASDIQNVLRYKELAMKTNRTPYEDTELNDLKVTLNRKLINASKINDIYNAVIELEEFFRDNTVGYIETKQGEFQAEIDKFDDKGDYNPSTTYHKNNMIRHDGYGFIVLKNNLVGVEPVDDGVNYRRFTIKGDQGVSGSGLSPRGIYSGTTTYTKDDLVVYDSKWWTATQTTQGNTPVIDSLHWDLYFDVTGIAAEEVVVEDIYSYYNTDNVEEILREIGEKLIYIGNTEPSNKLFWLDTSS